MSTVVSLLVGAGVMAVGGVAASGARDWWSRVKSVDEALGTEATKKPVALVVSGVKNKVLSALGADGSGQVKNPVISFNDELYKSIDEDGNFKPGTRFAEMSAIEYASERERIKFLGKFWNGSSDSISDVVVRMADDYDAFRKHVPVVSLADDDVVYSDELGKFVSEKIYCGGIISRSDIALYDSSGRILSVNHVLDDALVETYLTRTDSFAKDTEHFSIVNGSLADASGTITYIRYVSDGAPVNTDASADAVFAPYVVTDDFYRFLLAQSDWKGFADGAVDYELSQRLLD